MKKCFAMFLELQKKKWKAETKTERYFKGVCMEHIVDTFLALFLIYFICFLVFSVILVRHLVDASFALPPPMRLGDIVGISTFLLLTVSGYRFLVVTRKKIHKHLAIINETAAQ